jgi:hypothetical protein
VIEELPKVRNNFEVVIFAKKLKRTTLAVTSELKQALVPVVEGTIEAEDKSLVRAKRIRTQKALNTSDIAISTTSKRIRENKDDATTSSKREIKRVRAIITQKIYELEL